VAPYFENHRRLTFLATRAFGLLWEPGERFLLAGDGFDL
jgi:hypothetical protein